ncbi:UDP-glucose/GDP-mannose dehydrogenase family protein [Streptomyces gulbargensis]|uniref:UDP-glucose 6-dehydrogenase n=1 Tax=Streptomyces gulbargensis TaxID=364901 RepID=A0ABP7L9X9_9ACTN
MRVAVIGQGYVGLTGAVALARHGHRVVGVEQDGERLSRLRAGEPAVYEPGLAEHLASVLRTGRLDFVGCLEEATAADPVDAVLLSVGTPPAPDGTANLSHVRQAVRQAALLEGSPLVVLKSTVPPGTSDALLAEHPHLRERYVYNPEFLNQGRALDDWQAPARTVVGTHAPAALARCRELYAWVSCPWVTTTPASAEMIKYASNAFLAAKISFANEVAGLCADGDLDIDDVILGVGLDPRIGPALLTPGTGFGDSCLPKDTVALAHWARERNIDTPLLDATIETNVRRPGLLVRTLLESAGGRLNGLHVAVLGLRYEPWSDDLRAAPSRAVIPLLHEHDAVVRVWDPAMTAEDLRRAAPRAVAHPSLASAVSGAHAVLVLTAWPELTGADWEELVPRMAEPRIVLDAKNCLPAPVLHRTPALYRSVGNRRPSRQDPAPEPAA